MQWLAALSVKRPVFASVIILVFVVVGVLGYTRLPVDRFPKIDFPTVSIVTRQDGATPKEIETEITDKIEESVNTVAGIDELRSVSSEGISQVLVTFVLEKNIDVAAQEVRDRIARIIPELPEDVDAPIIEKLDPDAAPILNLALVADKPVREITEYADKVLRRQLESVGGVGQITLLGGRLRQINVWLDPMRLRSYNLTAPDVQRALRSQNVQIPAGTVKNAASEAGFRLLGKARSIEELGALVVREAEGGLVRLRDVARVEDGAEEQTSVARNNGVPSVVLSIRKQSGTNTVAVVDAVNAKLEDVRKLLPSGYNVEIVRDTSTVIRTSVHAVKEHLVLGAIFAAIVVLVFLGNSRATLISALAIPTSIIAAFGRFVRWHAHGLWSAHGEVFDIGIATSEALRRIRQGSPAGEAGGQDEFSNGNGSLMRILPVVLASLEGTTEALRDRIHRASAITHGHPRSQMVCVYFALLVRALMEGWSRQEAVKSAAGDFVGIYEKSAEMPAFGRILDTDFGALPGMAINSGGYVMDTLEAAVWCLLTTGDFASCVLKAVNLGSDTDTTGCVAGALAGVFNGEQGIPADWRGALPRQVELVRLFDSFLHFHSRRDHSQ